MPFITKGKRRIFVNDFGTKNSKDVKLLEQGLRVSELEAVSKLPDNILKEVFNDSQHLTKEEMFVAQNRPDLVSKKKLKNIEVLGRNG